MFEDKKCRIDPDLCTEYYECLRMKVCPEGAIYAQDLEGFYKEFQHVLSDPVETHGVTGVTGRGTDEGISIIVSGLIDRVGEITREMGLDPHNINVSLGIIGKTDRLPPADIRQYTTMCGHGMVAIDQKSSIGGAKRRPEPGEGC